MHVIKTTSYLLASFPADLISQPWRKITSFLHSCKLKSGSSLGRRLATCNCLPESCKGPQPPVIVPPSVVQVHSHLKYFCQLIWRQVAACTCANECCDTQPFVAMINSVLSFILGEHGGIWKASSCWELNPGHLAWAASARCPWVQVPAAPTFHFPLRSFCF